MTNVLVKAMYKVVDGYALVVGTFMTWNEILVDKYPKTMGFFTGVIIGIIFLK